MLTLLSWPAQTERKFLKAHAQGKTEMPRLPSTSIDLSEEKNDLERLLRTIKGEHPAMAFLRRTGRGYLAAAEMLESSGTARFTEISRGLFGAPRDRIHAGAPSHLEAAEHFLGHSENFPTPKKAALMTADEAAEALRERLEPIFDPPLPVVLAPGLRALATAGAKRVRLRAGTTLRPLQVEQLFQHEAMVHSATKRNGRSQPYLSSLGLSSPRTTCTQEGLATLAELMTDTLDPTRLRRIALRIRGVDAALEGADFVEVFRLFGEAGLEPAAAYGAAARIFRGGALKGRYVFTKDVVYLKGLLLVHAFLVKAAADGRHHLPEILFAGRMTIMDALQFEGLLDEGILAPPEVVPSWVANARCLSTYLLFTSYGAQLEVNDLSLDMLADTEGDFSSM